MAEYQGGDSQIREMSTNSVSLEVKLDDDRVFSDRNYHLEDLLYGFRKS